LFADYDKQKTKQERNMYSTPSQQHRETLHYDPTYESSWNDQQSQYNHEYYDHAHECPLLKTKAGQQTRTQRPITNESATN
jgi:hypothetical protein